MISIKAFENRFVFAVPDGVAFERLERAVARRGLSCILLLQIREDYFYRSQGDVSLDRVFQFTNVSGPVGRREGVHQSLAKRARIALVLCRIQAKKMFCERRYIGSALP